MLVSSIFLLSFISAEQFNSSILDSGTVYSSPSVVVDSLGVKHIVYSKGDSLVYINSADNFSNEVLISNSLGTYNNPVIDMDSNGIIHLVFGTNCGGHNYYTNSNNWNSIIELDLTSCEEDIDLLVDENDKVIIAGQKEFGTNNNKDIMIVTSTDFSNFNYQRIQKPTHQMNPHIALDSNNNIHLVYYDWSDGIAMQDGEMTGQYKIRYRNSIDNYATEENISNANQSYGADIAIDSLNNIWVTYKSTELSWWTGEAFTYGDIFLADRNSNWTSERITSEPTFYLLNRPTSITISSDNAKHFTWSEWKDVWQENESIHVMYARHNSPTIVTLQDISFEEQLGWAVIVMDSEQNPYIVANIHSLAQYEAVVEAEDPFLALQGQVNNLTIKLIELENKYNQLESKTNLLETLLNALTSKVNSLWASVFPPKDDCNSMSAFTCSGNSKVENKFKCAYGFGTDSSCQVGKCVASLNYKNKTTCSFGCNSTSLTCNPEPAKIDCSIVLPTYTCSYGYSVMTSFKCASGKGSDTSCYDGFCTKPVKQWLSCPVGCNSSDGRCIVN